MRDGIVNLLHLVPPRRSTIILLSLSTNAILRPQYVLRLVFHEVQEQQGKDAVSETPGVLDRGNDSRRGRRTKTTAIHSDDDRGAAELVALAAAAKGLLQRTRVLSKRLNSLCALHPQLMWELEEARRLRSKGEAEVEIGESLDFPDPFELGTLEVTICWVSLLSLIGTVGGDCCSAYHFRFCCVWSHLRK